MTLPVTAFVAAISALLLLLTAINTVRNRFRAKAPFGNDDDQKLTAAVRSRANLAEHAPIVIILFALLEMAQANARVLTIIGILFLAGRVFHIIGLHMPVSTKPPLPRTIGVISTWLTLAILLVWTLCLLMTVNL